MSASTFIKTFCSCSDTRNWYVHGTSTPSLSLWHTWIYFSYDIACSIDIGIHENAVFASVQPSLDSFPCEGMRYIVSIDWYLILVNGTSLRLYCFFTDHDSDSCRFSFVFDHFDQRTKRYLHKCLIVLLPHMDTLLPTRIIPYDDNFNSFLTHRSIIFLDALCRISFTRRFRFSLIRFIRFV